jgi:hypothetical protein
MALSSTGVATGIAALSISGVTVRDITAIPEKVEPRNLPMLFPSPADWMLGGTGEGTPNSALGPSSFGTPTTRYWLFNRVYQYIYLHAPVGSGRGLYSHYSNMATNADAILTAITTLDLTGVDVRQIDIGSYGTLQDPAGGQFYGFTVTVTLRERINA